jgi:hypothetical protein
VEKVGCETVSSKALVFNASVESVIHGAPQYLRRQPRLPRIDKLRLEGNE